MTADEISTVATAFIHVRVATGRVTRLEEYLDTAQAAVLRRPRPTPGS